jgi:hypothetical protein
LIETQRDLVQFGLRVAGKVGSLRQVLSQQAVGVFVGSSLPGAVRITEVDFHIVQQAVVTILNEIYEVDFQASRMGSVGIQRKRVNWVLDADIRGFFDNMNHEWTMKFVEHRVADRRILRLIQKWLKAGVSEDGQWSESTVGTPQGAVVSPRSNGSFTVWRKTAKKRMVAKLQAIKAELHRRMHEPTAEVGAWLRKVVTGLPPLLCSPGKHRPVECLRATSAATVAAHSSPPQPTTRRVGSVLPDLYAVDSSSTSSASLSYSPLPRHSSKVGAVCVEALVRICAGGDQR